MASLWTIKWKEEALYIQKSTPRSYGFKLRTKDTKNSLYGRRHITCTTILNPLRFGTTYSSRLMSEDFTLK